MSETKTIKRARKDAREGKAPSTQAGEFVREEIEHVREGKHGVSSPQQAIAIGLSKARRAGIKVPKKKGAKSQSASSSPSRRAQNRPSPKRSAARLKALKKEPRTTVSPSALAKQTHRAAQERGPAKLHEAAMKAVRTKGHAGIARAAKKAAHTREMHNR